MRYASREDELADDRIVAWIVTVRDLVEDIEFWRGAAPATRRMPERPKRLFGDTLMLTTWISENCPNADLRPLTDLYGWLTVWFEEWSDENLPSQAILSSTFEQAGIVLNVGRAAIRKRMVDERDTLDGSISVAKSANSANIPKIFPEGKPDDPLIVELIYLLHEGAGGGKSMNEIAREFTRQKLGDDKKAKSMLAEIRRLRLKGKVNL